MLTSRRMVPFSLHQLTYLGLDPTLFRFLIAKGVNAPLAAYAPICTASSASIRRASPRATWNA